MSTDLSPPSLDRAYVHCSDLSRTCKCFDLLNYFLPREVDESEGVSPSVSQYDVSPHLQNPNRKSRSPLKSFQVRNISNYGVGTTSVKYLRLTTMSYYQRFPLPSLPSPPSQRSKTYLLPQTPPTPSSSAHLKNSIQKKNIFSSKKI